PDASPHEIMIRKLILKPTGFDAAIDTPRHRDTEGIVALLPQWLSVPVCRDRQFCWDGRLKSVSGTCSLNVTFVIVRLMTTCPFWSNCVSNGTRMPLTAL